jgi:hypothetical protein
MIASLIAAAGLAVVAVPVGSFNEIFTRSLATLALVAFHALASLTFIDQTTKSPGSKLAIFTNTVFALIVLSFFTSVFGVWQVLPGEFVGRLYGTYLVLLFASLHGEMVAQTLGKQTLIDRIVYANFVFMAAVIVLLLPLIWGSGPEEGGFYYRLLAACGIVDATLTILAVILHRLYLQKHPEAKSTLFNVMTKLDDKGVAVPVPVQAQKRRIHPLIWLLGIFLIGQLVLSFLFAVIGQFD